MALIRAHAQFTPGNVSGVVIQVRSKLVAAAERAQAIVKEEAEALVPVDTGELRASIKALPAVDDGNQIKAEVVADAPHAAYVEFGTGQRGVASSGAGPLSYRMDWPGMPAQPYMRPALDTARARVLQEFKR